MDYHLNILAGSNPQPSGMVVHAVPGERPGDYDKPAALCGRKPAPRSCGWLNWTPDGAVVTCPKCRAKLDKLIA